MEGFQSPGSHIRNFRGNVRMFHKDIKILCNHATQYFNENRAELHGNVRMYQKGMLLKAPYVMFNGNTNIADAPRGVEIIQEKSTLIADRGKYSTETKIADFKGNVAIDDDSATVYADRIVHHRETENSFAYGNVWIRGKYSNSLLRGDTVEYYPKRDYTLAKGGPVLLQIDTIKAEGSAQADIPDSLKKKNGIELDTLFISSVLMESLRGNNIEKYFFDGNVEILRSNVAAKADSAVFNKQDGFIKLYDFPIVWHDSTQLYSDSTVIYIEDDRLERIHAHGNALAASRDDTSDIRRINQVTGAELIIGFREGKINGIDAYGNIKSLYFLNGEENSEGVDQKAADTIRINFAGGEPDNILWLGKVSAKYFPENLVWKNPGEYFLPDFKWTDIRPAKKSIKPRKMSPVAKTEELPAELKQKEK